jgi:hypothetical protein
VSRVTKPAALSLPHLYSDASGASNFRTREFALALRDFAPPAPPLNVSDDQPATRFVIISLPAGWVGKPHVSPSPQTLFCLSGRLKITCSTGKTVVLEAGTGLVMSDVSGEGHISEVISVEPVTGIIIQ